MARTRHAAKAGKEAVPQKSRGRQVPELVRPLKVQRGAAAVARCGHAKVEQPDATVSD